MNNLCKISLLIVLSCSIIACRPFSKESYLKKYGEFIKEVSDKGTTYTVEDWRKADEKFNKFNEDWYDHFNKDLTWQEKLTTTKYSLQYSYYKNIPAAIDLYNIYLKGDLEKLKERIKYYKDNKMDNDIQALIKQAKEIGDSSLLIIQQIISDIDNDQNKNK